MAKKRPATPKPARPVKKTAELLPKGYDNLQKAFPGMSGFSRTNVYRMRAFYLAYQNAGQIVPQLVGQITEAGLPLAVAEIPWGHNVVLLEQIKDLRERLWYARATVEKGWSRSVLVHWIESDLYQRQGKAQTNFERTLPALQSDLARETLKDPYSFRFIDLKTVPFKPEHAGKMNFYLSAVDDLLRHPDDEPSIGIIPCKAKNQVVAEYALRDLAKPVGVSSYITKLVESLPPALRGSLPSPKELEAELKKDTATE
jgi:predicted nuclease of restriction endonuclease-like (RecB) superfamily